MLQALIQTAQRTGALKKRHMDRVNIDTTVQEKNIAFPTDARLYYKMRDTLVRQAKEAGIPLRQSYVRLAKVALAKQARYAHAKQYKRARREVRRLKTYLGCVYRNIYRKVPYPEGKLSRSLDIATRILTQKRDSKNKIYSVHAPETECISKGKAHKRYEFGVKVGMATTSKGNWIIGIQAFHGNPYDGHTLNATIKQAERLTQWDVKNAYVDLGYRGHDYQGEAKVNVVNHRHMKRLTRSARAWMKRRAAIEPIFGHLKSDTRMSRNFLKGREGDQINAILCGCGFNMRKLLAVFLCPYFVYRKIVQYLRNTAHFELIHSY
jgi:IS5 family transposase